MGITTPLSTNPAMTIGGLTVGVTPIDMAHAYETLAHGGERVTGSMAAGRRTRRASRKSTPAAHTLPSGAHQEVNRVHVKRVLPASIAQTETSMLETVIQYGTGKAAALGQFAAGKTGTTSNYGDAWFVGWDSKYTVAVWVGYPNKLIPMEHDFNGGPVLGGTFPALIWHDFMSSALQIDKTRSEEAAAKGKVSGGAGGGETRNRIERRLRRRSRLLGVRKRLALERRLALDAEIRARPNRAPRTRKRLRAPKAVGPGAPAKEAPAPAAPTHEATPPSEPSTPSPSPTGGVSPNGSERRRSARATATAVTRCGCRPQRSATAAPPPW